MDITAARFMPVDPNGEYRIIGTRRGGEAVLVGTVDEDYPQVAHEIADALRAHGIGVDALAVPPARETPVIHFMTLRVSTGPDDSEWTDLETRSTLGRYPSASFAEEFDPIAEAVAALHPRPARQDVP